ncbi:MULTISPECIES: hypothetical protein [Delftia]|nr:MULTISPECIES: hypothetical protein [Delftia]WQM80225.1 hypothetical protein RNT40_16010 [Delftia tsuruhatensis]
MAPSGAVTRDGNSYSGTDVSGDVSINGQAPRNGGGISPQNQQAARGLASYASEPPPVMGQNRVPLIQAAGIAHSGNDWASRNALRNAEVSASSIKNTQQWGGRGAENNPAVQKYQAMLATDQVLQQAAPGLQAEGMRQGNALVRAAMEQQGQNQRAGMQAGLTQQRLDMDRETQGFTNRRQSIVEALRNQVAQEPNAVNRVPLVQRLRELEGTAQPDRWNLKVTPAVRNVDGSTSMGSVVRYNETTGQVEQVPMGQGGQQAIDQNPQAISIRNDSSLSREQKVEALRKLGYS